jgi:hypothetical protein
MVDAVTKDGLEALILRSLQTDTAMEATDVLLPLLSVPDTLLLFLDIVKSPQIGSTLRGALVYLPRVIENVWDSLDADFKSRFRGLLVQSIKPSNVSHMTPSIACLMRRCAIDGFPELAAFLTTDVDFANHSIYLTILGDLIALWPQPFLVDNCELFLELARAGLGSSDVIRSYEVAFFYASFESDFSLLEPFVRRLVESPLSPDVWVLLAKSLDRKSVV